MPTYDYACRECGHEFELFQSMSAPVKRRCPSCGKPRLQRLVGTGAGVIFKGSGFYETDYRSDSYKKAAKAETGDGASTESASSSKDGAAGESKPAGAAKPKKKDASKKGAPPSSDG